jgi:hypothetical protein
MAATMRLHSKRPQPKLGASDSAWSGEMTSTHERMP